MGSSERRGSSYRKPRGISAMTVQQARIRSPTKHSTSEQFFIDRSSFPQRTAAVATAAAAEAEAVDRDARFPQKAIDAARQQKLLGVQIPRALGGDNASISALTEMCYTLARPCPSTPTIFSMPHTNVPSL